jgi:hypothetical protein
MTSMNDRIRKLEKQDSLPRIPRILNMSLQESGLDATTYHWHRAWALARPGEAEEFDRCYLAYKEASEHEDPGLYRLEEEYLRLTETVLRRESPVLADDMRVRRDLLHRELARLTDEWRKQGRQHSTWDSDREFWNVATARPNRRVAIHWGAKLVLDPDEALEVVAQIVDAKNVQQIFALVGRI